MKKILARTSLLILAVAVVAASVTGCNRKTDRPDTSPQSGHEEKGKEGAGHAEHGEHEGEKAVKLGEAEMKEFGIEVGDAGPGKITVEVRLPGEVVPNADAFAHIVPRFPGIVKAVRKDIGDKVAKGEVLAVIESNESLTPYEVKSLIDGTVIEKHIVLGELIKEDVHAFVIADLSSVWVNLSIYQKDLATIRKGQRVIVAAGHGIGEGQGEISYVAPVVNERTRTGLARVSLPNPEGRWRPGLFVTARVIVDEIQPRLVIPKTALQMVEEKTCIFIQDKDGFEPRPVTLGRSNETHAEIVSGLDAGQRYVTRGAFTLKAQLSKASFGDGHAH